MVFIIIFGELDVIMWAVFGNRMLLKQMPH